MNQAETGAKPRPLLATPALRWAFLVAAMVLFVGLGFLGYRWATMEALAVLAEFSGEAQRDEAAAQGKWSAAQVRDEFFDGDGAKTQKNSLAHFRLTPGAKLTLRPASQIRFRRRQHGRGSVGLTVEVGEADVSTKNETLTIDSQFGTLVIQQNSLVRLRRDGSTMQVSVELGAIQLGAPGGAQRRFSAGDRVVLEMGGVVLEPPTAPLDLDEPDPAPTAEALGLKRGDGIDLAELVVPAGETFVVHDPAPPTAIGFRFQDLCPDAARLTLGKLTTEAIAQGNLKVPQGTHEYRVECLGEASGKVVTGEARVLRDSGVRPLPSFTPSAEVAADGRKYTVLYQQRLPQVTVTWPAAPAAPSYSLLVDGRTYTSKSPSYTLRSGTLGPGPHQVVFRAATEPVRQSRSTAITVTYDSQAPTARVADPPDNFQPGAEVPVEGQALPGWSVSLDGKELELDGARRFSQKISQLGALAVTFSHPQHGIHYYLRRPRKQAAE